MDADTHLAALKGQYLHGLLDAGFSREELTQYLDSHPSGPLTDWSLEQLKTAGEDFAQKHKTAREQEAERLNLALTSRNHALLRRKQSENVQSWKKGFLDGCFLSDEEAAREFITALGRKGIKDIDNLSEDELKSLTKAYKTKDDKGLETCIKSLSIRDSGVSLPVLKSVLPGPLHASKEIHSVTSLQYTVSTQILPPTVLTPLSEIDIDVEEYSQRKWYLFDTTAYLVTTKQLDWFADRRMEDFIRLSDEVTKAFPGYILPMFPGTESTAKSLQWYLKCLLSIEIIRKSPHIASFLLDEVFSPPETVSHTQRKVTRVEDMWSLSGTLMCDIDESSDHITWQTEFFTHDESSKQKISELLISSESHQTRALDLLKIAQKVLTYVGNLTSALSPPPPSCDVYQRLSLLLEDWSFLLESFQSLIQRYILALLHVQVRDYASVGRLMDLRSKYLSEYRRNKNSANLRGLYGFLNHQSKAEITRLLSTHNSLLSKALSAVLHELLSLFSLFSEKWERSDSS